MYEFDGTISKEDKKSTPKKYNKSNLIYSADHSVNKYHDTKNFEGRSLESEYSFQANFSNDLGKLSKLKSQKEKRKEKKTCI